MSDPVELFKIYELYFTYICFSSPQCTATCGSSTQTRDVVCIKKVNKKLLAVVGSENCKEHKKPDTMRPCPDQPECPSQWYMTRWSKVT